MDAMAQQSIAARPATALTAEQFLAANKPIPGPPLQEPRPIVTNRDYVPAFESTPSAPAPTTAPVNAPVPDFSADLPKKEGGLFSFLRKDEDSVLETPVGAAGYQNPYDQPGIDSPAAMPSAPEPASSPDPIAMESAISDATSLPAGAEVGNERGGIFGKLFGKRSEPADFLPASAPPVYEGTAPDAGDAGLLADAPGATPGDPTAIPDPVSWEEEAPPAPAAPSVPVASNQPEEPAAIFRRSSNGSSSAGSTATVAGETSATVNGVKVKLFPGTNVTVIDSSGGNATIRLPDGRTGTVSSDALSQ